MTSPALRSFRIVSPPGRDQTVLVEALLAAQGFVFAPDPLFPLARRLLDGPMPLGSSLAAHFGLVYIQDRSSMLPPLALAPQAGEAVLDMCASPGGKTGILAGMTGASGFTLANEPSRNRLATLRRNLGRQNLLAAATSSFPGERSPLPDGGWGRIQLDPPCSGWGTVEKNPQVLRLWSGEKLDPLVKLQRRLLAEAARLLRPGGRLVYSTCTTNVQENEDQTLYAREELGLALAPLEAPAGIPLAPPARSDCGGVWRVDTGPEQQGFFVARLEKAEQGPSPAADTTLDAGPERRYLARESLDSPGLDSALLPPGRVAVFNDVAHFLPKASFDRLPPTLAWKGFPLGRLDRSGRFRGDPYLRALMPPVAEAAGRGLACLDLEEVGPALGLISGQSMAVSVKGSEMGLYFRGLPLCLLTVKGGRALLPPRMG
jgi:16S rRNA (cytosine1407-C5)-methyltransferase